MAHIDSAWVYPGADDYDLELLLENDLTDEAFCRSDEVRGWIAEAQQIVAKRKVPAINTGLGVQILTNVAFWRIARG